MSDDSDSSDDFFGAFFNDADHESTSDTTSSSDGDDMNLSDLDMNDDLSDRSFDSDTDSSSEEENDTQATASSLGAMSSQSTVDGEYWTDVLDDVDIDPFIEVTGPCHTLDNTSSILDFFFLMFCETFIETLTAETNRYAEQKGSNDWSTTAEEIMAYIGLLILMGVNQLPSLDMYWSNNSFLENVGFKKTMTRLRFTQLHKFFHIADNTSAVPQGQPGYDRLNKIRPLITMARRNFKKWYKPNRCQSIDEGMIKYKGNYFAKQYMPAKPVKRGLKIWMRCEESGYCGDFRPYLGKHDIFQGRGLGTRVVKHLCRPLKGKNHWVFFDSYFTSLELFQTLEYNGIYGCGTAKANITGIPDDLKNIRLERGNAEQRQHNNLVVTAWQDKKLVYTISTCTNPTGDDPIVRRVPGGNMLELTRPPPVTLYQKYMGGVDRCMQHRSKYPVGRPSKKYWKYLFNFILEVCIINAFILWKETPGIARPKKRYTLLDFRVEVATSLIRQFANRRQAGADNQGRGEHQLSRMDRKRGRCRWCYMDAKKRKETIFGCAACGVHLCIGNCFTQYHNN